MTSTCDIDFELLLKYIDSLKWITIVGLLFLVYRVRINRLIDRITTDADEISFSFFTAKFRNQIMKAKDESKDFVDLKSKIDKILSDSILDEIKIKSINFKDKKLNERIKI